MRARRIGRAAGRTAIVALFGFAVTAAGVVGVSADEPDDYHWDRVPGATAADSDAWGNVIESAAATASDYHWD